MAETSLSSDATSKVGEDSVSSSTTTMPDAAVLDSAMAETSLSSDVTSEVGGDDSVSSNTATIPVAEERVEYWSLCEGGTSLHVPTDQDAIIVVGQSVVGKSTFIQFMAGYDKNLISVPTICGAHYHIKESLPASDGRIIGESGVSTTKVPLILKSKDGRLVFTDCPGFGDTEGHKTEIRQILQLPNWLLASRSLKFVLVVEYCDMVTGKGIENFVLALESFVSLVSNIDKYQQSFCVVASKVPLVVRKDWKGQFVAVGDEDMRDAVTDFLVLTRNALNTQGFRDMTEATRTKCWLCVDVLIKSPGKLGLFRRPDEAGPLSKILLMSQNKEALLRTIEATSFITPTEGDFKITLSPRSWAAVHEALKMHSNKVRSFAQSVARSVENRQRGLINPQDILTRTEEKLKEHLRCAIAFFDWAQSLRDRALVAPARPRCLSCDVGNASELQDYQQHLAAVKDLQAVFKLDIVTPVMEKVKETFDSTLDSLENQILFFEWLKAVKDWLCQHAMQRERTKYNVRDMRDWGKGQSGDGARDEVLDEEHMRLFMGHVRTSNAVLTPESLMKCKFNEKMLSACNFILTETLDHELDFRNIEAERKAVVTGTFVSLQELFERYSGRLYAIKQLIILAKYTVFFDRDFDMKRSGFKLAVMAPRWEVVGGARAVLLTGPDGESLQREPHLPLPQDGRPGLPGGQGGCFLGLGEEYINCDRLTVSVCGGRGGPGESGRSGNAGRNGANAKAVLFNSDCSKREVKDKGIFLIYNYVTYNYSGYKGAIGCNGGDGGAGGCGGRPGSISFSAQGPKPDIVECVAMGDQGAMGRGGEGGQGGKTGATLTRSRNFILFIPLWMSDPETTEGGWAEAGQHGRDGVNRNGQKEPSEDSPCGAFTPEEEDDILKQFCRQNSSLRRLNHSPLIERLQGCGELTSASGSSHHGKPNKWFKTLGKKIF